MVSAPTARTTIAPIPDREVEDRGGKNGFPGGLADWSSMGESSSPTSPALSKAPGDDEDHEKDHSSPGLCPVMAPE